MDRSRLIVGIDLGTTHTAVAFAAPGGDRVSRVFTISQQVARGELESRALLPSVLFATLPGEAVPASDPADWVIGEWARRRAAEVPGRAILSAKSWLCHPGVDREAPILPWGVEESSAPKLSPVEASSRLLGRVTSAWNLAFPERPLQQQTVVLTVPASFDGVARELTVRAADRAGLQVRLLEEPQAAFYDYLSHRGTHLIEELLETTENPSQEVLVCDVGGGTTDLTLIRAARGEVDGALRLSRSAVGRHLLLGGDNIDLALAQLCEARLLSPPERLEPARFGQLVEACRHAKETLLGPEPPDAVPIRLLSGGSALVGATLRTEVSRSEVEALVFQGFLPAEATRARPGRRSALVGFGLPYESDPAVTHHLAEFLERHLGPGRGPRAVLFNGGLFRSERVRQHLLDVLNTWFERPVVALPHVDPDLSVARGAVSYGLSLLGEGPRIEAGAAHGYYVGVAAETHTPRALCVVPRGAAEGEPHWASAHPLALRLGEPVRFQLYAADHGVAHAAGELVDLDDSQFSELSPLVTELTATGSTATETRVRMEGVLSAVGTVELSCVEVHGSAPRRFRLAFDLAPAPRVSTPRSTNRPVSPANEPLNQALVALDRVFGKGRGDVKSREVKDLWRDLERLLGERASWSFETNRRLFDALLPKHAARRRSADHERVFFMLAGHCLRPGFGHPKDRERVAGLFPLFEAGLAFPAEARSWQQLFIAFRRIAGGLNEGEQTAMRSLLAPFIAPDELKLKRPKHFKALAPEEIWELVSWLERVPAETRAEAGHWLIEHTYRNRDPRLWTWLGRVGARIPAYASAHYVVARSTVERWVDHLLREKWSEVPTAAEAALKLSRVTGDRTRDLSDGVREELARRLEANHVSTERVAWVRRFVPLEAAEREAWFDDLPVGLRLDSSVEKC